MRTWKVLSDDGPREGEPVPLTCECGVEALVPTKGDPGAPIVAIVGRAIIFSPAGHDPPDDWLPESIQCRRCARIYSSEEVEGADVREVV